MEIILAIILGGFFGFALYFVGASSSYNITDMLSLRNMRIGKTILFAIGFSATLLGALSLLGVFNSNHISVKPMNLGVIVGGLIFGIGFGWVGACPGTCPAALSSGSFKKAVSFLVGGLLGAFVYSSVYGAIKGTGVFEMLNLGKLSLFKVSDKFEAVFSFGYGGILIMGLIFMGVAYLIPNHILDKN